MIQLKHINRVEVMNNFCLVRISRDGGNKKLKLPGTELEIDTSFNPERHVDVLATVMKVPTRLTYFHKKKIGCQINAMMWRTRIEIKKGDKVYVDYLEVLNALGPFFNPMSEGEESRFIITPDKDLYVFVHYSRIYAKIVHNGIHPLNGYVICARGPGDTMKAIRDGYMDYFYKVIYTGHETFGYAHSRLKDVKVYPGDWVCFRGNHRVTLSNAMIENKESKLLIVQRRDIIGILNEEFKPREDENIRVHKLWMERVNSKQKVQPVSDMQSEETPSRGEEAQED
jgi:translation initiation factor IF-1